MIAHAVEPFVPLFILLLGMLLVYPTLYVILRAWAARSERRKKYHPKEDDEADGRRA